MKEKMLVALDGGIESLVTAWLLKKQGFQLRAVLFDVSEMNESEENNQKMVSELEKKLGIPIQLVVAGVEARELVAKEIKFEESRGFRYDVKSIFHQKFLFPKLFMLKEQLKFQKIATGHRVSLSYEPLEDKMKVLRYSSFEQDEAHLLVGLEQEELRTLMFPLGSIPIPMIHKLASELELKTNFKPSKFDVEFNPDLANTTSNDEVLKLDLAEKFDQSIIFVNNQNQEVSSGLSDRVNREVWLENASWFSGEDLGFKMKSCMMYWKEADQPVSVRLSQYEGGGIKALLDETGSGEISNLANGDEVIWIEGDTVLGGARVVKCL